MLAICTTGAAIMPTKKVYMIRSPRVMAPLRMAWPPMIMISTPMAPMMAVPKAVMALVPVRVPAMFLKSRSVPSAKIFRSRSSAT
jgi:hypothetical protein